MSILSEISRIQALRDARIDAVVSGDAGTKRASPWVRGGFILICVLAVAGFWLLIAFSNTDMPVSWAFSAGIEAFGILAGAIIYYCCMQDPDSAGEQSALLAALLGSDAVGLFLDECAWLVQGKAKLVGLNIAANTVLYMCNCFIVILFWRYASHILQIREQVAHRVNIILSWLSGLIEVLLLVNLFVPLLFSVDAAGFYHRGTLFPLALAPVLVVLPPLTQGFVQFKGPEKIRKVARLFFAMPLVGIALSCVQFGISVQYSAVLLSVLLALGVIVADRGRRMTATRTELNMAVQIQESMLPSRFPAFPDRPEFDLYASMDPAREVGGDFYDFFLIDDDHLALLIADVSDKGVPAALMMMSAKILIHYRARQGGTPSQILGDVNDELCDKNDTGMFVTVWMGILDTRDGTLVCTNAGHENPAVRRADGAFRLFPDKHGLPLGVMPGMMYRDYTLELGPGDAVFVYTDGVPEANNPSEELYGLKRLEASLNRLEDNSPQGVLSGVRADVDAFVGSAKQFDDLTMLCLEYRGSAKPAVQG